MHCCVFRNSSLVTITVKEENVILCTGNGKHVDRASKHNLYQMLSAGYAEKEHIREIISVSLSVLPSPLELLKRF